MILPYMQGLPHETWLRHAHSGVPLPWLWPAREVIHVGTNDEPIVKAIKDYLGMFCVALKPGDDEHTYCPGCGHMLTAPGFLGSMLGSFTWSVAHGEGYCNAEVGMEDGICDWPIVAYHRIDMPYGIEPIKFDFILPYHPWFVLENCS